HVNSIDNLVLTHLDIYDDMNEIEACVAYNIDGKIVTDFPASIPELNRAKPVLQKFAGWKQSIKECTSYKKLPKAARDYVEFIEDFTGTKVGIVSVGADRNQTFVREKIWR
nr:adenylosuccinate synthetase [Treponema sp.]